jgi:hypothetical protein
VAATQSAEFSVVREGPKRDLAAREVTARS